MDYDCSLSVLFVIIILTFIQILLKILQLNNLSLKSRFYCDRISLNESWLDFF